VTGNIVLAVYIAVLCLFNALFCLYVNKLVGDQFRLTENLIRLISEILQKYDGNGDG